MNKRSFLLDEFIFKYFFLKRLRIHAVRDDNLVVVLNHSHNKQNLPVMLSYHFYRIFSYSQNLPYTYLILTDDASMHIPFLVSFPIYFYPSVKYWKEITQAEKIKI